MDSKSCSLTNQVCGAFPGAIEGARISSSVEQQLTYLLTSRLQLITVVVVVETFKGIWSQ